jgi:hypothetical protein
MTTLTKTTLTLAATATLLATGCNKQTQPDTTTLNFAERQALAAKVEVEQDAEPGAMQRVGDFAKFVFVETPKWALEQATGQTPIDYARNLDSEIASDRQAAILNLADRDFGDGDDYVTVYRSAAVSDDDPLVRAAAVRALNLARVDAPEIFTAALDSEEATIRLEAAKALANLPAPAAEDKLLELAENPTEQQDVRIAAANALRNYPDLAVARRLANLLTDRDFGVAWQSAESLRYLTGQDFDYEPGKWLTFLSQTKRPFG